MSGRVVAWSLRAIFRAGGRPSAPVDLVEPVMSLLSTRRARRASCSRERFGRATPPTTGLRDGRPPAPRSRSAPGCAPPAPRWRPSPSPARSSAPRCAPASSRSPPSRPAPPRRRRRSGALGRCRGARRRSRWASPPARWPPSSPSPASPSPAASRCPATPSTASSAPPRPLQLQLADGAVDEGDPPPAVRRHPARRGPRARPRPRRRAGDGRRRCSRATPTGTSSATPSPTWTPRPATARRLLEQAWYDDRDPERARGARRASPSSRPPTCRRCCPRWPTVRDDAEASLDLVSRRAGHQLRAALARRLRRGLPERRARLPAHPAGTPSTPSDAARRRPRRAPVRPRRRRRPQPDGPGRDRRPAGPERAVRAVLAGAASGSTPPPSPTLPPAPHTAADRAAAQLAADRPARCVPLEPATSRRPRRRRRSRLSGPPRSAGPVRAH